jgi:hypothetical protein
MTTPVSLYMIVAPGTHINPSPEYAVLHDDPAHPTPTCTTVTAIGNATAFHGTYSMSSCTAVFFLTQTQYLDLCSKLSTNTVRVDFTYDSSVVGNTKPILDVPTFTIVTDDFYLSPLAYIAKSIKALDERVQSGASAELHEDIKFIRKAVEELVARR